MDYLSTWLFQAMVPIRAEWPDMVRTRRQRLASQIWTSPWFVPMARCVPRCVQATEVTQSSSWPRSHSLVTCQENGLGGN